MSSHISLDDFVKLGKFGWEEDPDMDNWYLCHYYDIPVCLDNYFYIDDNNMIDIVKIQEKRIIKIIQKGRNCKYTTDYDGDFGYLSVSFTPEEDEEYIEKSKQQMFFELTYNTRCVEKAEITICFKFYASEMNDETLNKKAFDYYNKIFN